MSTIEGQGPDAIYIPPFTRHEIVNDSDEDFDILSIGWDDAELARQALEKPAPPGPSELILAPPATPNGGLHIGHMSGPYLRADLLRRMSRVCGTSASFITGSDESQSYVDVRARQLGVPSAEFRDMNTDRIRSTYERWGVECDAYIVPSRSASIADGVRRRFERLMNSVHVRSEDVVVAYCADCQHEVFQGHVTGTCPHCSAGSAGDLCEACGQPNTVAEMRDVTCNACGNQPEAVVRRQPVLDLSSLGERIRALASVANASSDLALLVDSVSRTDRHVYPLTRRASWGTRTDTSGNVIDPWLELGLVYLATIDEHRGEDRITLLLGYDNSYYYGVLLTAVAIALGEEDSLPSRYITNRFLQLEGQKFSTSRGHAVWADDAALPHERIDALRAKVLRNAPEGSESSVSAGEFIGGDDPLISGVERCREHLRRVVDAFDGVIPSTGAWTAEHKAFYASMLEDLRAGNLLAEGLSFSARGYIRLVESIVDRYRVHLERELVLASYPGLAEERRTGGALAALGMKHLASFLWPASPRLAEQIWSDDLRLPGSPERSRTTLAFLDQGAILGEHEAVKAGIR